MLDLLIFLSRAGSLHLPKRNSNKWNANKRASEGVRMKETGMFLPRAFLISRFSKNTSYVHRLFTKLQVNCRYANSQSWHQSPKLRIENWASTSKPSMPAFQTDWKLELVHMFTKRQNHYQHIIQVATRNETWQNLPSGHLQKSSPKELPVWSSPAAMLDQDWALWALWEFLSCRARAPTCRALALVVKPIEVVGRGSSPYQGSSNV